MANNGTREKIIEAAYVRFYQHGYNGTSVQDVVEMVGVQKGTFYNYFKSKERLALEALKHYACIADRVFPPPGTVTETPAEKGSASELDRIRNQFLQAARFQEGKHGSLGCLMGNLTAESDTLPASFRKLIRESFRRWDASLAASLERAQQKNEIHPLHRPEELARYVMSSWQGALLLMKNSKSRVPIDDFFRFTFDVLVKADPTTGAGKTSKLRRPGNKS